MAIREHEGAPDDDEDDRVTNPGAGHAAWVGDPEDDEAWAREANELQRAALGGDRAEAGPAMLRTRPRRTAASVEPEEDDDRRDPTTAPRARPVNEPRPIPAPVARFDTPLFQEAFGRPVARRTDLPRHPLTPVPPGRAWRAWLIAGAIALVAAVGLTAVRTGSDGSHGRSRGRAPHARTVDATDGAR